MGGEKELIAAAAVLVAGSPPRGRGKVERKVQGRGAFGITPAWAGKSATEITRNYAKKDHPRVGGEKGPRPGQVGRPPGSPPRGRGKDPWAAFHAFTLRITPAWAGKREFQQLPEGGLQDHPRVGGEKSLGCCIIPQQPGSPPRGRGKAAFKPEPDAYHGITPAWAGKSVCTARAPSGRRDHPRVGGEKAIKGKGGDGIPGSPPRGRGKAPR